MSNPRIAFLNPVRFYSGTSHIVRTPFVQTALAHTAKQLGAKVMVIDGRAASPADCAREIANFRPTHLHASTRYDPIDTNTLREITGWLRTPPPLLLGGDSATLDPEGSISRFHPAFLFRGSEEPSLELLIRSGFSPVTSGTVTVNLPENGTTVLSSSAKFNLDTLPLPGELPSIFPPRRWHQAVIEIARGCAAACSYCGMITKPVSYMSAETVVQHFSAWRDIGYNDIELFALDLTASPRHGTEIIRSIRNAGFPKTKISIFMRIDTFARARQLQFENGETGEQVWEKFLSAHTVEMQFGVETFSLARLLPGKLEKYRTREAALEHYDNLVSALEIAQRTGTKVNIDLLSFDPDCTLRGIKTDYETLLELARKYPFINILPSAIVRGLVPIPGTPAAQTYGAPGGGLQTFRDRRVQAVLLALQQNPDFFCQTDRYPLTRIIRNIIALLEYTVRQYPDTNKRPSLRDLGEFAETINHRQ